MVATQAPSQAASFQSEPYGPPVPSEPPEDAGEVYTTQWALDRKRRERMGGIADDLEKLDNALSITVTHHAAAANKQIRAAAGAGESALKVTASELLFGIVPSPETQMFVVDFSALVAKGLWKQFTGDGLTCESISPGQTLYSNTTLYGPVFSVDHTFELSWPQPELPLD